MKYFLDTNILSYLEEQTSPFHVGTKEHLYRLSDDDEIFIPILILYELRYSVSAAAPEKAEKLDRLVRSYLEQFPVQQITARGAEIFGDIKAKYRNNRPGINQAALNRHNIDFILASSAIAENAVLVSNDRIFEAIREIEPVLKFENWAV
jgi:predicted nucleic acid-binding protein